jgi:hypothetical protein
VHHMEEVAQKLLGPTTNLVNRAVVFQDLFDTAAIAKPVEGGSP